MPANDCQIFTSRRSFVESAGGGKKKLGLGFRGQGRVGPSGADLTPPRALRIQIINFETINIAEINRGKSVATTNAKHERNISALSPFWSPVFFWVTVHHIMRNKACFEDVKA